MKKLKLKNGIHWIGSLDPELRVFDIIMYTEFGTTYNSYLVQGTEKTAVFETVKVKCFDEYVEKLKSEIDIAKLDYIVVDHTEPDHSGSVEMLLELAPTAKVVGSAAAIRFLKAIANRDFESIVVNSGDTLDLGGKTLKFISAPFLHWPDSIYTYIEEDKLLITCDSFGSHYSLDDVLFSKMDNEANYRKALKYYFDMIMGPFKSHMLKAIDKIEDLDIDMICPGHGPVLDVNPWDIVNQCKQWSTEVNPNTKPTVVIPYVSAYGYTAQMADEIKKGLESTGDIDVNLFDMVYTEKADIMSKIHFADGVLFGSPTINSDALPPISDLLMSMSPVVHGGKLAGAFGSYGWSGEAVKNLEDRMKQVRLKVTPGLRVNFKPSGDELGASFEFGARFGEKILGLDITPEPIHEPTSRASLNPTGDVKKWRCIICDEVFDGIEPPDVCPACGASHEQFEEYIEETITFVSDLKANIVIVGNNAAGTSAADAIRKRNKDATIRIISAENTLAYYRPMLSDYLSDSHDENMFYLHDADWYLDNDIALSLGKTVESIDSDNKQVVIDDGSKITYDKLILANGSRNHIPQITDANKTGVFSLKTKEDADAIKAYAKNCKTVAVIGAGLLGLEAAWELKHLGLEVSVIEFADRILPRQLDIEGSEIFEMGVKISGIQIYKEAVASSILGKDAVTGVQLCDGGIVPADMVLISTGIRPNRELAETAGLHVNRGVVVDTHMQTSDPDIYAAGDVAEHADISYAVWPEALEQGKVAGANVVGDMLEYHTMTPSNVFNGMNMNIFSIGDIGKSNKSYKVIADKHPEEGAYKKLYFVDDHFVGGILIGDVSKTMSLMLGINRGTPSLDMVKDVVLSLK